MAPEVLFNRETGEATLSVTGLPKYSRKLKFGLMNTTTGEYLTSGGWITVRKALTEFEATSDQIRIPLGPELTRHIDDGARLALDEIFIDFRQDFRWPEKQVFAKKPAPQPATMVAQSAIADNTTATITNTPVKSNRPFVWAALGGGACLSVVVMYMIITSLLGSTSISPVSAEIASPTSLPPSQQQPVEAVNEKRIAELQKENTALRSQLDTLHQTRTSDTRPDEAVDAETFTDLQNQLAVLKAENTGLANRVREQSKTINDWTTERIIDRQKMQGYEQQIALQDIKLKELSVASSQPLPNIPSSYWVAAAVNGRGSVEVVTQIRDRDEAQRQALAKCTRTGPGCKFIGSYENACFSLARPQGHPILPGNFWYAGDAQKFNANKRAVMECNRVSGAYCSVAISYCASEAM